ncbi:MAG: hypothetical protein IH582_05745 [Afipia sp.]|nr:hypothetical protein [Afipia sp.]
MAYGDTWTWTGIDADSKLIVSWLVGGRDGVQIACVAEDRRGAVDNADVVPDLRQTVADALGVIEQVGALGEKSGDGVFESVGAGWSHARILMESAL